MTRTWWSPSLRIWCWPSACNRAPLWYQETWDKIQEDFPNQGSNFPHCNSKSLSWSGRLSSAVDVHKAEDSISKKKLFYLFLEDVLTNTCFYYYSGHCVQTRLSIDPTISYVQRSSSWMRNATVHRDHSCVNHG